MHATDFLYIEHFKNNYRAVDVLFERVDDFFCAGQFDEVDEFLKEILVEIQSVQMLVCILTVTLPAKEKLKNRDDFFKRVTKKVTAERNPKSAERLLMGLE